MNTFHNFAKCIYTSQGKVVCQKKETKTNVPMLLETFVNINTTPNQKDCNSLAPKFNDLITGFNCNINSTNKDNDCTYNILCKNK